MGLCRCCDLVVQTLHSFGAAIAKCLFHRESLWTGVDQQSTIWCTSEGAGQSRGYFPRCGSRWLRLLHLVVQVCSLNILAIDDTQKLLMALKRVGYIVVPLI